ncbi:bifunctional acetate--CoA ligase family protein/GNAT family N-acetyltransferase [Estrella lausannensis]|uniref:GNAT family acetyltransferase n=1 Tax=Estrella lausannensis TaxID=483423 RepID=A0A0H5DNS9_9BACT|nr:bifunctional acetate--CoA ligase family protein/GNAT family N-acetyltransferase [Estrella lausannensis]CRX37478.1 GNAT family acetyltransferase [Estrella lausannensis]
MQHTDPSQNFIGLQDEPLKSFFHPASVALIGAKDDLGSVGRTLLLNLIATYKGEIYPVNPKRDSVFNLMCYKSLKAIAKPIDLAIIATPAKTVPSIMKEIADTDCKSVIIISAGFKETGQEGLKLEEEILSIALKSGIRIIGPNCIGLMNPITGLNATFAKGIAKPGNLAFISQSGAMCTAVLDWSFEEKIGFSAFVSIGSMCDVSWGDLIHYLGNDPNTRSILIYMETIGNPRNFLSAAREIALEKPIIVIKGGRSQQAAKAAASHTGSLAGSDDVFEAALERVGVLRVNTISELFDMASLLAKQPLPKGPRLGIITNAGGPSVLATDAAVLNGVKIDKIGDETVKKLDPLLPKAWSRGNPIDILGDADPKRYFESVSIVANDPSVDGLLVILSPQDMTDPTGCAESLRHFANIQDKPIIASWMGGSSVKEGMRLLNQANIPTFAYPDDAASSFAKMWSYTSNLSALYETPTLSDEGHTSKEPRQDIAIKIIDEVRGAGRALLTEEESKRLLQAYGIPTVITLIALSEEEAIQKASEVGYPCVLKLLSKKITHKTDVGGVKLNLKDPESVRKAFGEIRSGAEKAEPGAFEGVTVQRMVKHSGFELILGSMSDPQFGPIVLFGTGGELVEIYRDKALGLPPLTHNLSKKLIAKTKISKALEGYRGRQPVNIDEMANLIVHFSQMVAENLRIKECDINPLIASGEEIIALDARVVLHDDSKNEGATPPSAIRPYPKQYIEEVSLKSGTNLRLRPIRPEDETMIIAFHKDLSENSVRQRYFSFLSLDSRIAHERLIKICFNDFDQEISIVAESGSSQKEIVGVGRLSRVGTLKEGKLTLIIKDAWHGQGLGSILVPKLIAIAKKEGWKTIAADVLEENSGMLHILAKNGFQDKTQGKASVKTLVLSL